MRRHPHTGSIPDVKAQGFVRAVAIQSDAAVGFRQDVYVDDGGDGPEVLGHADADVWPLAVDVIVAQRDHRLLLTSYCVGAEVSVVDLFCREIKGDRETESVRNDMFQAGFNMSMCRQHSLIAKKKN